MVESGQGAPTKRRAALYIDGFNLYHAVNDLQENFLKWCDFWRLGEIIIPSETELLVKVVFCTAFYPGDFGKKVRHEAFIKALRYLPTGSREATGSEHGRPRFNEGLRGLTKADSLVA